LVAALATLVVAAAVSRAAIHPVPAGGIGAATIGGPGRDKTAPSAPRVLGPRQARSSTPVFRFRATDPDDAAASLRFRCAVDSPKLHACAARYRQRLEIGTHVLRVRAVDPAGNASRLTRITVQIEAGASTGITTISIPPPLGPIAVGEGAVWVENRDATVTKVDPATNAVVARIPTPYAIPGGFTGWIATGYGSVWISNDSADDRVNSVTRIDAATNAVVATIPVGTRPTGLAVTPAGMWVANHHGVSLSRIDPASNQVVATIPLRSEPGDLAFAAGSVWLSELDQDRPGNYDLERLDPFTGAIIARMPVPGHITFGTDGTSLWLGSIDENKIYPVNLATDQLGPPFTATSPLIVGVGLGAVWTASGGLVRYDPSTGKTTRRWPFANSGGLAVGYDSVWVGSTRGLLRIHP